MVGKYAKEHFISYKAFKFTCCNILKMELGMFILKYRNIFGFPLGKKKNYFMAFDASWTVEILKFRLCYE